MDLGRQLAAQILLAMVIERQKEGRHRSHSLFDTTKLTDEFRVQSGRGLGQVWEVAGQERPVLDDRLGRAGADIAEVNRHGYRLLEGPPRPRSGCCGGRSQRYCGLRGSSLNT